MARFGTWRPLGDSWDAQPKLTADIISLHTMVGSLPSTDAMFHRNGYGGTFSHFGIGGSGEVYQWQDTRFRGAANYNGNHRIISVETADMGPEFDPWDTRDGGAVPSWTDAQLDALAALVAEMCGAHLIPCELIPDSLPGRRGVGYHRQGIDGNFPDGRVAGGEVWSTARGKVCPGNRRIAQIPVVISRARALLAGQSQGPVMPILFDDQEDDMYIKCQPVKDGPVWTALLSGPIFVGLGGGEAVSADAEIAKGARVQWVGKPTWDEIDRRSHALCDLPKPVRVVEPVVPNV